MSELSITLIQTNLHWEDRVKNLAHFEEKINAIKEHPDIIVLPEMFSTSFSMNAEKLAESEQGVTFAWLKQMAYKTKAVVTGSVIIKENNNYYNRLIWMNPDGKFLKYDKKHLFRLGKENVNYTAGIENIVAEINGWKFRPLICYDLRFPVWSMNRLDENNQYEYDCLLYVASWPRPRKHAWKSLLIARAIENQAYVIGLNRHGIDGLGAYYEGESMIVDFNGNVIHELKSNEDEIYNVKLSYNELTLFRNQYKFALDWDKFNLIS